MVTVLKFGGKQVAGILKSEAYFCKAGCTAGFGTVEHEAFEVFTSQVTDLVFADHPADTVHDIALATAIGSNDTRDTFIKIEYSFIGKTP